MTFQTRSKKVHIIIQGILLINLSQPICTMGVQGEVEGCTPVLYESSGFNAIPARGENGPMESMVPQRTPPSPLRIT
jgi:hypothetical protein